MRLGGLITYAILEGFCAAGFNHDGRVERTMPRYGRSGYIEEVDIGHDSFQKVRTINVLHLSACLYYTFSVKPSNVGCTTGRHESSHDFREQGIFFWGGKGGKEHF